jgi:LmbE family N-acetylglucosaminyl deacetylase
MPLRFDARTRLLVVAPHPDDESIATGELIQHVRAAGGAVDILLLTAGDNNPWPQRWLERRLHIGAADRQRWGARRRGEVARALGQLGLPAEALHPLDLPDMGITARLRDDLPGLMQAWQAQLEESRPNLVALPSLGDSHPDHSAAHVLTRLALADWSAPGPLMLSYLVHGREPVGGEPVALAAGDALHANKLAALGEHQSQMALSGKRMFRLADRAEHFRMVASAASEGRLPWRPGAALRPWLRLTVADGEGARTWPWLRAPLEHDGQGGWRLALQPTAGPRFAKLHMDVPSPWIFDRWGWCEL